MQLLKFFDVKNRKPFESSNYEVVERNGRKFAKTTSPSGVESWRILPKDFEVN